MSICSHAARNVCGCEPFSVSHWGLGGTSRYIKHESRMGLHVEVQLCKTPAALCSMMSGLGRKRQPSIVKVGAAFFANSSVESSSFAAAWAKVSISYRRCQSHGVSHKRTRTMQDSSDRGAGLQAALSPQMGRTSCPLCAVDPSLVHFRLAPQR